MPKVVSVPDGLYFVGTEEPRLVANTNAGAYIAAFTKSRDTAFALALDDATKNMENAEAQYQAKLKFLLDSQKGLQDRLINLDKLIADIETGNVNAKNEMRKFATEKGVEVAIKQADLDAARKGKMAERVFPATGSSKTYDTGVGFGGGVSKSGYKLSEKEQAEQADSSRAGGGNPVAAIENYENKLQGPEGSENRLVLDAKLAGMVYNEIKQDQARNPNLTFEEAEANVLLQLDDAGKKAFVDAYMASKPPETIGGGGKVLEGESTRGYGRERKFADIEQTTIEPITTIGYTVEGAPVGELKRIRDELAAQLDALELPPPPEQDLITAARRIYRDRFGPTTGGRAGFEERLRSSQMVNEPARGAQAIENFREAMIPEASEQTKQSMRDLPSGILASNKPILDLKQFDATALEAPRMAAETPATAAPMEPKETMQNLFVASNQATEKTSKPSANRYLLQRYLAGKQLADQGSKLDRLINSGPGKVASQVYAGNVSKNLPLSKTLEEITFTYADDPANRDKAIDIAMALDLKSENSKKMPTV